MHWISLYNFTITVPIFMATSETYLEPNFDRDKEQFRQGLQNAQVTLEVSSILYSALRFGGNDFLTQIPEPRGADFLQRHTETGKNGCEEVYTYVLQNSESGFTMHGLHRNHVLSLFYWVRNPLNEIDQTLVIHIDLASHEVFLSALVKKGNRQTDTRLIIGDRVFTMAEVNQITVDQAYAHISQLNEETDATQEANDIASLGIPISEFIDLDAFRIVSA